MEVRPSQSRKAFSPIDEMLLGIVVVLQPATNSFVDVFIIALQFSLESYTLFPASTVNDSNWLLPANGFEPMLVTVFGIVTDAIGHPSNAPSPMEVTLLGMVTEVKLLQE